MGMHDHTGVMQRKSRSMRACSIVGTSVGLSIILTSPRRRPQSTHSHHAYVQRSLDIIQVEAKKLSLSILPRSQSGSRDLGSQYPTRVAIRPTRHPSLTPPFVEPLLEHLHHPPQLRHRQMNQPVPVHVPLQPRCPQSPIPLVHDMLRHRPPDRGPRHISDFFAAVGQAEVVPNIQIARQKRLLELMCVPSRDLLESVVRQPSFLVLVERRE